MVRRTFSSISPTSSPTASSRCRRVPACSSSPARVRRAPRRTTSSSSESRTTPGAGPGLPAATIEGAVEDLRPRLRGVSHQYAFFLSLGAGAALVAAASGARETVAASVFAGTLAAMFGVSAAYHRILWSPRARRWMRRLDHTTIYLLIAGTYTPVALLVLPRPWSVIVLAIAWSGCAVAIALKLVWVDAPKWLAAAIAVALGWLGVAAFPHLARAGVGALVLLSIGGVLYTVGAVVYARERPDPVPAVFGYHEVFHACVIAAAACQYAAVAALVV